MRYFVAALVVLAGSAIASADEPAGEPSAARGSIERGVDFLAKDAVAWKSAHDCASCHHAAMVVWSLREAKERGIAVDEPVLADMTHWMAQRADGKIGVGRSEKTPDATGMTAVYFGLALEAEPQPDAASAEGLKLFLKTLEGEQAERGSWSGWPDMRPPMLYNSEETITMLVLLVLIPPAASGDEQAKAARDKGLAWLAEAKTDDDPQAVALRLVLWRRLGRPAEQWEPLVRRIQERQNADGGWSQTAEMPSDAFATGQAIWALNTAGIKSDDPAFARGRAFLVATQREDGSWPMISRPLKPGGDGAKNLIPITGAGSAWGVIGLVRSL